nr:FAD-binding oxidoreductase [Actinomycetota bacterium]
IVRDLVLDRQPFVDVSPLAAERFEQETPRPEHNVI